MTIKHISESQWPQFFDDLSRSVTRVPVEIDVGSVNLGSQTLSHNLILQGISYDPKDTQLELLTPDLAHRIEKPKEIHVEIASGEISSISVTSGDDTKHIILFKQPLEVSNPVLSQAADKCG